MPVEIEMRARFDEEQHARLVARLEEVGEDLGPDDKHIHFYVLPDKLLKVTDNIAAGTAKITLKSSRIGQGAAFPETEITIARDDVPAAVRVFDELGFGDARHEAFNQRRNFRLRGVDIAVKWSEAWGHHAEFELLLDDCAGPAAHEEAQTRIAAVAGELGVRLMTEAELAAFTQAFEQAEQQRKQSAAQPAATS